MNDEFLIREWKSLVGTEMTCAKCCAVDDEECLCP